MGNGGAEEGSGERGISRRRVVTGVAWAAPAIAIASSAPARGVVSPEPGILVFNAAGNAGPFEGDYRLEFQLRHAGPFTGNAAPITGIYVDFEVPSANLNGAPSTPTAGWSVTVLLDDGTTTFVRATLTDNGGELSAPNDTTPQCFVILPRDPAGGAFDTTLTAVGMSAGVSVGDTFDISVQGALGVLAFANSVFRAETDPATSLELAVGNTGDPLLDAADLQDVEIAVAYPVYYTGNPPNPSEPGWTRTSNTVSGSGPTRIRTRTYAYSGGIAAGSGVAMTLDFPGRNDGPDFGSTEVTVVGNASSLGQAVPEESVVMRLGGTVGADGVVSNAAPGPWPGP